MQWIRLDASTVNGIPSRHTLQTTHVKHCGWYGLPVALRIRSRIGSAHTQHFSKLFYNARNGNTKVKTRGDRKYWTKGMYQVAFLAVGLSFDGVKGLALQAAVADAAGEAGNVEHALHGRAAGALADDLQSAIGTHSCTCFFRSFSI